MIRVEIKEELIALTDRMDEEDRAEEQAKSALLSLLAAIDTNQERAFADHVAQFTRRLLKALRVARASRN